MPFYCNIMFFLIIIFFLSFYASFSSDFVSSSFSSFALISKIKSVVFLSIPYIYIVLLIKIISCIYQKQLLNTSYDNLNLIVNNGDTKIEKNIESNIFMQKINDILFQDDVILQIDKEE